MADANTESPQGSRVRDESQKLLEGRAPVAYMYNAALDRGVNQCRDEDMIRDQFLRDQQSQAPAATRNDDNMEENDIAGDDNNDDDDDNDGEYRPTTAPQTVITPDRKTRSSGGATHNCHTLPLKIVYWDPSLLGQSLEGVTQSVTDEHGVTAEYRVEYWYDAYGAIFSPTAVPPPGVHNMSDFILGQILEAASRGCIAMSRLSKYWPNIFSTNGCVRKTRKHFGRPYLIYVDQQWCPGSFYGGTYDMLGSEEPPDSIPTPLEKRRRKGTGMASHRFLSAIQAETASQWKLASVRIPTVPNPASMDEAFRLKLAQVQKDDITQHPALRWSAQQARSWAVSHAQTSASAHGLFSTETVWSAEEIRRYYDLDPCTVGLGASKERAHYDVDSAWAAPGDLFPPSPRVEAPEVAEASSGAQSITTDHVSPQVVISPTTPASADRLNIQTLVSPETGIRSSEAVPDHNVLVREVSHFMEYDKSEWSRHAQLLQSHNFPKGSMVGDVRDWMLTADHFLRFCVHEDKISESGYLNWAGCC